MAVRGKRYELADWHPNRCRTIKYINLPYLAYAFTMFTYQPYTVARMNYTILMAIRTLRSNKRTIRTRAVSVEWRYVRYEAITQFVYKCRRISQSSSYFLITMKSGLQIDQRNRNDGSRHGASSMCSSSPWHWRRREKEREKARRLLQVNRRKQVKAWLKRRVILGHNKTLLREPEEDDIASFKNYIKMDRDTFRGFVKNKNKIREKLGSGWVG